ncbi:MAG: PepSY-associated TM helix domain-containing protein [Gemmatimonadota bacterium]|nr:PepSY-associated TM helix domain-containing protein [Gemmatimonadota bacterium]
MHLWIGVIFTFSLIAISITGILLNHKRVLGLMPAVEHEPSGPLSDALTLSRLAEIGLSAVPNREDASRTRDMSRIDRMDVRPRNGYAKVRLRDSASTEVTVDLNDGRILHVGPRGDVLLERLHSGEVFGGRGVLLSDAAAVALVIALITGYWLWLAPKLFNRNPHGTSRDTRVSANPGQEP